MTAGGSRAGRSVGTSSRGGQVASSRAKGKGRALDDGNASAQRALNRSVSTRAHSTLLSMIHPCVLTRLPCSPSVPPLGDREPDPV